MSTTGAAVRPVVVDDWMYRPCPQPPGTPAVVCFPHAGGDVTAFADLAAALAPDLEVWAVRLPGRGGRSNEPMPDGFAALVRAVRNDIVLRLRHLLPDALFYGQSFGALLAYEVARALPAGLRPRLVVPACASAPHRWPDSVPDSDHAATDLLDRCGIDVDESIRDVAVTTIEADLAVCRAYRHRPDPVPDFAVHAVAGADDPMVRPSELAGWARATAGPFSSSVEPGGHLLAAPFRCGPANLLLALRGSHDHVDRRPH